MAFSYKPTYKKLIATVHILLAMYVAVFFSEKMNINRNFEVFAYLETSKIIQDGKKQVSDFEDKMKPIQAKVKEHDKKEIQFIHTKHFLYKAAWFIFLAYSLSCLLFHRIDKNENT